MSRWPVGQAPVQIAGVSAARERLGRGSGRRRLFWGSAHSLEGPEGVCDRDEGAVVVPARPGSAFEVCRAQGLSHLAVVVLYAPAALRGAHKDGQLSGLGQVGEPELHGLVLVGGPFGQQPADRKPGAGRGPADLMSGGPDPQDHEARVHALVPASATARP